MINVRIYLLDNPHIDSLPTLIGVKYNMKIDRRLDSEAVGTYIHFANGRIFLASWSFDMAPIRNFSA